MTHGVHHLAQIDVARPEGVERLEHLRRHGPGLRAFTFGDRSSRPPGPPDPDAP